jgi:hypothetical protein
MKRKTWNEWLKEYRPIYNPHNPRTLIFDKYGEDAELLRLIRPDKIWTMIETKNDETQIAPGFRIENQMGYFVTEISWVTDETLILEEV